MCNKKYNYPYLLLALAGLLAITACSKNLEQTPQATASRDAVFSSSDGLQLYANSFYNILPAIGSDGNSVYKVDANLSDLGARGSVPDYIRTGAYNARQSTGWTWTALRNINYFIANNNNAAVAKTVRDNYTGLARFFRAYFYFGMVQRFGDVPWITKALDPSDSALLYAKRDPRAMVMDSVLADINYAISHITLATDASKSQITKWVAYGLKSRICLFEGTFRRYQTSYNQTASAAQWLQDAATASKAVMDSAGQSLNTSNGTDLSYRTLFINATPVTNEIMLSDVTSSSLAVVNDANWWYTSATYGVRFSFTRMFINTYLNIDGTPFTSTPGYDTLPFNKETLGRDKRLQQTIRTPGYTRVSSGNTVAGPPLFSYTFTGYQPIKWCLDDMYYDAGNLNTNSVSLMRYAEILLNYAEAKAELGTITDDDWKKTIGALRSRAGITGGLTALPTVADSYMKTNYYPDISSAPILEIRRERAIELSLEGFRFADLIRWKHGELMLKPWNGMYVRALNTPMDLNNDGVNDVLFYQGTAPTGYPTSVTLVNVSPTVGGSANSQTLSNGTYGELHWLDNVSRQWADYMYLYPIPYNDLQLNPNLGQNPTWQ
ncbi:MAG: RagB/SusD family nutrient uptake outer membrane protein [Chitinophagaceae bacterium]